MSTMDRWSPLLWLCLGGCAVTGEDADPFGQDRVEYTFTLESASSTLVRVSIRVLGEDDGTTRFEAPTNWGGAGDTVKDCQRFAQGFAVRDASGRKCPLTRETVSSWTAEHEPGELVTAGYELRPANPDPLSETRTRFEPVVRPDLFQLLGDVGLVYPGRLAGDQPIDVRLRWVGFRESGWTVVSSFDAEGEGLRLPLGAFRHSVFLAGRLRVHDRDVPGGRLRVALYGKEWPFEDGELVERIERVIAAQRRFTGDLDDPFFLVTVVPAGVRATPTSLYGVGGTALRNAFSLSLPPGTLLGSDAEHSYHVLALLAHEYFHTWNGNEIPNVSDWFTEGFTEFFASRLLRRSGLIDDERWRSALDQHLRTLWLSPVATAPGEATWTSRPIPTEVQLIQFQRGIVVALMLDEEIRRVHGGQKSLDDFFLELLAASSAGEPFDPPRLLERIARWTTLEFAEMLRRTVEDGALPDPPALLSEPRAVRIEAGEPPEARIPQYQLIAPDEPR